MAIRQIRYLVARKGAGGTTRWFWQPSTSLQKMGFRTVRIAPSDTTAWGKPPPGHICDAADLWNQKLDTWRKGDGPHPFDDDKPIEQSDASATRLRKSLRPGTVDALIARYRAHHKFLNLADSTRRMYNQYLDIISEWAGDLHVLSLDAEMALEFYDRMFEATPTKANHVMTVLRLLYSFAKNRGKTERVPVNPFRDLGLEWKRKKPRIWTPEEVEIFVSYADKLGFWSIGTAVLLNEWIGQRQGDVIRLSRTISPDGSLEFIQSKTDQNVDLPIAIVDKLTTRLQEETARWHARGILPATLIASERSGRPYNDNTFSHAFRQVRDAVAQDHPDMAGLWFMRLRHTAVVRLGEAGNQIQEVAAVTGHTLQSAHIILERYNVRTRKMARSGLQKRVKAESRNEKT